jgi:Cu(I)/Ag(I) efflux system membrane fusion protein
MKTILDFGLSGRRPFWTAAGSSQRHAAFRNNEDLNPRTRKRDSATRRISPSPFAPSFLCAFALKSRFRFLTPLLAIAATLFLVSCGRNSAPDKPANVDYYTCAMHPSVRSMDPKTKCPICSMDLIPVMKKGATNNMPLPRSDASNSLRSDAPTEFTIPVQRQQQIGVTYAAAEKRFFTNTIRSVGIVAYNKQRHWDYVTRVEGYVDKLFVFSRGELVEKDGPLLSIYSPDLLTTQREFVDLLQSQDTVRTNGNVSIQESTDRLVESARQRLRLWNISDSQIAKLEKTRQPQKLLTLHSPFKGIVQNLGVDQGRRVMLGEHLVDIADLSVVWVWAEFYQDDLPGLKKGMPVVISSSSYPGEELKGTISLIDPFMNEASRTGRVRIDVDNAGMKLRPDMYVDVIVSLDMGESLAVPASGVLPTGRHNVVFIKKEEGKLEPRYIELGRKFGDYYELHSGLEAGDQLVTSANFLIDAEAKIQGALRSW